MQQAIYPVKQKVSDFVINVEEELHHKMENAAFVINKSGGDTTNEMGF